MSKARIRCWSITRVPRSVRDVIRSARRSFRRRPHLYDWVLEIMPGAVLPIEVSNSIVGEVQTPKQKAAGKGRRFVLVSGQDDFGAPV